MKKKSDKGVRDTSNSVHKPILKVPCALKKHLKITFALTIKGRCGAARAAKTLRFEKYSGRHGDDLYTYIVQFVKYILPKTVCTIDMVFTLTSLKFSCALMVELGLVLFRLSSQPILLFDTELTCFLDLRNFEVEKEIYSDLRSAICFDPR